jgi:hypothetical protein
MKALFTYSMMAALALQWLPGQARAETDAQPGVAVKVERAVARGARAAASGVERGAKAAASGVERGVRAAASGVERGAKATTHAASRVATKITGQPAASSANGK